MNVQNSREDYNPLMRSDVAGFGQRVGEVVRSVGLTQAQFAARLNTSTSFVSDVIRGLKRPGWEFLAKLKEELDVSIDWLIDGTGAMHGEAPIRPRLFRAIALEVALAYAAKVKREPDAIALFDLLLAGSPTSLSAIQERLEHYSPAAEPIVLAATVYNSHLNFPNPDHRAQLDLRTIAAMIDSRQPMTSHDAACASKTAA